MRAGKTEWAHALAGGLSVCGAEGSVARSDTVPEAVIIGKTKKNKYKIWFGHTLLSQCCCWQRSCFTLRLQTGAASSTEIRGRFFDPFLIKGLKYPVRNKSH